MVARGILLLNTLSVDEPRSLRVESPWTPGWRRVLRTIKLYELLLSEAKVPLLHGSLGQVVPPEGLVGQKNNSTANVSR